MEIIKYLRNEMNWMIKAGGKCLGFVGFITVLMTVQSNAQTFEKQRLVLKDQFNHVYAEGGSGGWLAPQFSQLDIDADGQKEIIAFDRFSELFSVWTYNESAEEYEVKKDLKITWPRLRHWALVRDYNADGIPDIFTQGNFGIAIWEGQLQNGVITFTSLRGDHFIDDSIVFQSADGSFTNLVHANTDIPIIEDVDGDGDLDIMAFESTGSYVYYYECKPENTSSLLSYKLKHECWGNFVENSRSNGLKLSNSRFFCPLPFSLRHVGSTLCLADLDNDDTPDLLVGDLAFPNLMALTNTYSADSGYIESQRNTFPHYDHPAYIYDFPAAYKVDFNLDGDNDLIVTNNDIGRYDFDGIYLYLNEGGNDNPYRFVTNNAFVNSSFDLGRNSAPYFIDVNGDDIQDVIIAYNRANGGAIPDNRLALLHGYQTGDVNSTIGYQLIDDDYLTIHESITQGIRPILTSGDVDGDGDLDLVMGMSNGDLHLILNKSNQLKRFEKDAIIKNWLDLDVGLGAAPELYDMDGDGLLDLLLGQDRGMVHLFKNVGSKNLATYGTDPKIQPNVEQFAGISTVGTQYILGRSVPRVFQFNGEVVLAVSGYEGNVQSFSIATSSASEWQENSLLESIFTGVNGNLTVGRTNESKVSVLMGNIGGGLQYSLSDALTSIAKLPLEMDLELFPNPLPSGQSLRIELEQSIHNRSLLIFDIYGKVHTHSILNNNMVEVVVNNLKTGIYIVVIKVKGEVVRRGKIVVQ